jgi:signal transduction histidine kinase
MQEQERGRIARDIHDDLGQLLTALDFDLAYVNKRLKADQEDLREKAAKMSELIRVSTETVQRIASELRPALLDNLGLMAAMEWQADEYSAHTGIDCEVNFETSIKVSNKDLSTALFRAFQEALTNAARHANPSKVSINVKKKNGLLTLEVSDDGKGISEKEVTSRHSFGLSGIMERFYPFGGNVKIKGIKDKGTTVSIEVPIGDSHD